MSKKMIVAMMLAVSAAPAYAIAPCSQVCPGPSEPCSLRCYLPGPFVTTCDQVYNGRCVPVGVTEEPEESASVCEGEIELAPIIVAWVDAGIALANGTLGVLVS